MKKILSIIVGLAITMSAQAQIKPIGEAALMEPIKATSITKSATAVMDAISINKSGNTLLANYGGRVGAQEGDRFVSYMGCGLVARYYPYNDEWSFQLSGMSQTPVAYDPYTKTLFAVSFTRTGMTGDSVRKAIQIAYSTDLGQNWKSYKAVEYEEPRSSQLAKVTERHHSTIAVSNATQSNNFADIRVSYRSWVAGNPAAGAPTAFTSSAFGFLTGQNILDNVPAVEINISSPWTDGSSKLFESNIKSHSAIIDGKPWVYFYGMAEAPAGAIDSLSQFTLVGVDVSTIPTNADGLNDLLENNAFAKILPEIEQNFNFILSHTDVLDADANGNLYFLTIGAVNYANPGEEDDNRTVPKIFKAAKTNDGPPQFAPIDSVSKQTITNYLTGIGANVDWGWAFMYGGIKATSNFFTVTNENEYTFITPLCYQIKRNGENVAIKDLLEFSKQNGEWTIRKIDVLMDYQNLSGFADVNSVNVFAPFRIGIDSIAPPNIHGVVVYGTSGPANITASEAQLAITANGDYLVAKYIKVYENANDPNDPKNQIKSLPNPIDIHWYTYENNVKVPRKASGVTQFPYAQTFLSYRPVSGGDWSEPVLAIHSDTINTSLTMMPRIVPDINNVPIFFVMTTPRPDLASDPFYALLNSLPPILQNGVLQGTYNIGMFTLADATQRNDYFTSIKEGAASEVFTLDNANPNPASTDIYFGFSLAVPNFTTLTIYNELGQVIEVLANGFMPAKYHTVEYNTSKLPVGAYYYVLTSGSKSETKMFNVVR